MKLYQPVLGVCFLNTVYVCSTHSRERYVGHSGRHTKWDKFLRLSIL